MTDKEIKDAFEHCVSERPCVECVFKLKCLNQERLGEYALDLINRQQVKNKELDEKLIIQKGLIDTQQAEIKRLKKEQHQFADIGKMYSEVRAEAVKEFAERLKDKVYYCEKRDNTDNFVIDEMDIDNLVKEMTEVSE